MLSRVSKISRPLVGFSSRNFATAVHTPICIVGAGAAGINVAAQLIRNGVLRNHIRIFDPSKYNHYQPGWTLVGGGISPREKFIAGTENMIPRGVSWIDLAVSGFDPENNTIETEDGSKYSYDQLVVAAGIQLNYDAVKGLKEALEDPNTPVASIYTARSAQKWSRLREEFKGGKAVFTHPPPPMKCAGSSQKIMYLSHDTWNNKKKLNAQISYHIAPATIFTQPDYAKQLEGIAARKNIEVNYQQNLVEVRGNDRVAVFKDLQSGTNNEVSFDVLHVVPPQKPQDFLRQATALVDGAGYVDVNQYTLRSNRYSNVWSLGDCSNLPTSKTQAAVIDQTPVLVNNLLQVLRGKDTNVPLAAYHGYTCCPITVGGDKILLAEFKYNLEKDESFAPIQGSPRTFFFYLKKYLFPFAYFNLVPRGLWYGRRGVVKPQLPEIVQEKNYQA